MSAPPTSGLPRFRALDSLRGLAAVMVALFHFRANSHVEDLALVRNAWLFVDFFFVLSGFVIAANYGDRIARGETGLGRFLLLRIARLYPLHLATLALFVLFEVAMALLEPVLGGAGRAFFTGSRSPALLPENLLLLHGLGFSGELSWNVPSWSISVEFWLYAAFGALMLLGAAGRWLFWGLGLVLAPALIWAWHGGTLELLAEGAFLRGLAGFATGTLLWHLWPQAHRPARHLSGWMELPVALGVGLFVTHAPGLGITLLAPAVFGLAVWVFAAEGGVLSRLLTGRAFLLLGTLSFSIYMTHTFVHARLKNLAILAERATGTPLFADADYQLFGPDRWAGSLFVLAALLLTLALSWVTWRWVERPGQALGRTLAAPAGVQPT